MRLLASMAVLTACDGYTRSADPILPSVEVIFVESVVVAGRGAAYMLVGNPHGSVGGHPLLVDAKLSGPDWTAAFSESVDLRTCGIGAPEWWPGQAECWRATLPEPIQEATRYTLVGITPLGSFRGQTIIPRAPVVHQPDHSFHVRIANDQESASLTLLYTAAPEVGLLGVEPFQAIQILEDGTKEDSKVSDVAPSYLAVGSDSADVVIHGHWHAPEFRVSLRLIGFEENYSRFVELLGDDALLGPPWPNFGIEGVIGYFGGGAPSRPIPVVVEIEPEP